MHISLVYWPETTQRADTGVHYSEYAGICTPDDIWEHLRNYKLLRDEVSAEQNIK